jgi:cellulose synthase/poly-beta-1,6-N-acetylglucosamine synthase-like glycosyltransferase
LYTNFTQFIVFWKAIPVCIQYELTNTKCVLAPEYPLGTRYACLRASSSMVPLDMHVMCSSETEIGWFNFSLMWPIYVCNKVLVFLLSIGLVFFCRIIFLCSFSMVIDKKINKILWQSVVYMIFFRFCGRKDCSYLRSIVAFNFVLG